MEAKGTSRRNDKNSGDPFGSLFLASRATSTYSFDVPGMMSTYYMMQYCAFLHYVTFK